MEVGGLRYEIEPIQDSPSFQHLIYRKTPWPREPCGGILEVANESGELRIIDTDVDDNPLPSDMQVSIFAEPVLEEAILYPKDNLTHLSIASQCGRA